MTDFTCPHCDNTTPHTIEKLCTKCEQVQPHTLMAKDSRIKDGMSKMCKAHAAAKMRAWNDQHREQINATGMENYWKTQAKRQEDSELDAHVRALSRARSTSWRQRNPERAKARSDRYSQRNRVKLSQKALEHYYVVKARRATDPALDAQARRRISAACRRWAIRHPEKARMYLARWRANKRNAPINDFTADDWELVKEAFHHKCVYCPATCQQCRKGTHKLTQEHLTPLSKGGAHTLSNIVPACKSCNSKRGNRDPLRPVQPLLL